MRSSLSLSPVQIFSGAISSSIESRTCVSVVLPSHFSLPTSIDDVVAAFREISGDPSLAHTSSVEEDGRAILALAGERSGRFWRVTLCG